MSKRLLQALQASVGWFEGQAIGAPEALESVPRQSMSCGESSEVGARDQDDRLPTAPQGEAPERGEALRIPSGVIETALQGLPAIPGCSRTVVVSCPLLCESEGASPPRPRVLWAEESRWLRGTDVPLGGAHAVPGPLSAAWSGPRPECGLDSRVRESGE